MISAKLSGRIYTADLDDNADVVKYKREVLAVKAGDQVCVKYADRTQPEIMPDGTISKDDSTFVYYVENCVDIIGMPNKMADERTPEFN